jgi:hypothetical protein
MAMQLSLALSAAERAKDLTPEAVCVGTIHRVPDSTSPLSETAAQVTIQGPESAEFCP